MRILFLTVFFTLAIPFVYAQKGEETIIPLSSSNILQEASAKFPRAKDIQRSSYSKTTNNSNFPFIDQFNNIGTSLNDSLWDSDNVKTNGNEAVLNAQNGIAITYNGGDGLYRQNDVLLSKNIDLSVSKGDLFIEFMVSSGSTWSTNDSLVLEAKTSSGNYQFLWNSPSAKITSLSVRIPLDIAPLEKKTFNFRFILYTQSSDQNTATYLLQNVVLADRLSFPFYENFTPYTLDSIPTSINWQRSPGKVTDGSRYGITTGANMFIMNAMNERGNLYGNGSQTSGFADTLHSQSFNFSNNAPDDSIYLRFEYRSSPSATTNDSLMLEFLNSGGRWIKIWETNNTTNAIKIFSRQINISSYRHPFFQFRLINKCRYSVNDSLQFLITGIHIGQKRTLPFIDDFSDVTIYPNAKKWKNKNVYINNSFAIRPPSINVATFDGLDFRGNAYGQGDGILDTLTSWPINLTNLRRQDSVYLSFFIEPKGLGDIPRTGDFLYLEFRTNNQFAEAWTTVWSASVTNYPTDRFSQIFILVDSAFLHDDFQLRFKNYGSKTGNLNNWHVDYVQLDRGRKKNDGYFDAAISNTPPSLLNTYYSMPRKHYDTKPTLYTNTLQKLILRLNHDNPSPINYGRIVFNGESNRIDSFGNTGGLLNAKTDTTVQLFSNPILANAIQSDSLVFIARYYTNLNNNLDNIRTNDTCSIQTLFSNFFAYDDGSAEAGYGIKNEPGGVALGYTLEIPDTLMGISFYLNQSTTDVSQLPFNLMVWSAIGTNGSGQGELVLKRIPFIKPPYTNKINGFYYYRFDQPILLPAGKFYIGWEQTTPFVLNMGFDRNYQLSGVQSKVAEHYFKLNDNIWQRSNIEGALMMRPLVGKWLNPPTGILEQTQQRNSFLIKVFPNPANQEVYIETESTNPLLIEIRDLTGKRICSSKGSEKMIHLPDLASGIYLIKVQDLMSGDQHSQKLIINQH